MLRSIEGHPEVLDRQFCALRDRWGSFGLHSSHMLSDLVKWAPHRLTAQVSNLFLNQFTFCGHIVDSEGVRFHLKNNSVLMNFDPPSTAGGMCKYVYGMNWIFLRITRSSERVSLLCEHLGAVYARAVGSRKRCRLKIYLESSWVGTRTTTTHFRIYSHSCRNLNAFRTVNPTWVSASTWMQRQTLGSRGNAMWP